MPSLPPAYVHLDHARLAFTSWGGLKYYQWDVAQLWRQYKARAPGAAGGAGGDGSDKRVCVGQSR